MISKFDKKINQAYLNFMKDYEKKIYFYFSYKTVGDNFNPHEKNYTENNLNPIVIKGIVREIDAEKLVWKSYGLERIGAVEVLVQAKYKNWFKKVNKIEIDNQEYMTYSHGVGNNAIIQTRPFGMIRVVLAKIN